MKTHIRKLTQKSINLLNKTKAYPDEQIVEGYHIVGSNRALFAEKPLYIFLEKFIPTGKYNIRYGGLEIKKALKGKLKDYIIDSVVTSYCIPEAQKRIVAEALIDKNFKLGWKIIRKLSEKL
jgi:hypothetical protein